MVTSYDLEFDQEYFDILEDGNKISIVFSL